MGSYLAFDTIHNALHFTVSRDMFFRYVSGKIKLHPDFTNQIKVNWISSNVCIHFHSKICTLKWVY